ncbi:trigger factor [Candidatus Thiothrix sp. Deng01]|uniref:Trigger factor n=1 Tax=Candidatus Thiothrix phosphatis TaxID=3112415 RepID=A0ABU6D5N6_9GAMM|nr:trigger factor [Candidatus Thiothrix sp. Deng01]MEB4593598.1 trigger factor [Candidatus Thiothrix sp. Deng01]
MQVSVETTGNIDRKMTVAVPAEQIDKEVDKRLKGMVGRVRIDGFRPGKVPFSVVKKRYGDSVRFEVVEKLLGATFQEAASQEKLRVAGLPEIDLKNMEAGKDLEYVASFQIYPEVVIAGVETLAITRPVAEITEADLDKMIDIIRKQNQEWVDVDRAAAVGDMLKVDFAGTVDGEAFEGGAAEDYVVELGAGRMLKDFEDGLLGMKAGDEKTIDVAFPEDYHADNLKGKTAQFKLAVKQVREPAMPEVNEDFIKKFGVESGSVEEFRAEIKKNMQRELDNAIKTQLKQQVMDGLAELHAIDIPNALINDEIRYIRDEFSQNTGSQADNMPDELFAPQAERRVKLGLIVGEIIRQNALQRDPARVDAMLEAVAASYEEPEALKSYYRSNRQAMQTIEAAVMEEMIVDWAMEKATVTDEHRDFDSVMNPNKQGQAVA